MSDLKGRAGVVLYFYPKDSTPGCTIESQDFSQMKADFERHGWIVLGVSRDSVASHEKFRDKYNLKHDLLCDAEEELCAAFDVIHEKNMYGKKVLGVVRSTFLIDRKGVLIHEWRGVKVPGHAAEVLKKCQELGEKGKA